jgi:single-stranded-DNA-specific exonuclease
MTSTLTIRQREVPETVNQLPADMHPVIRRVLAARGVTSGEQLSLGLSALLSPDTLGGIEHAAELVADAVMQNQKILIVGDFDTDGATGTALAVLSLQSMGCTNVDFRVPNRFEFGYGLTVPLVETLQGDRPDLLLTVDSGIGCISGVERARAIGCRVIVTDHHLPGDTLPAADAIVNPNCTDDAFPSKAMAGVGVMFYLLGVVRRHLRERDWFSAARPEPNLAQFLDLVALGTVADLVPLDRNNRVLVKQGLERIRRGMTRPGLMALLRLGKRDYRYANAADLGFAVGPRLNAAGRLDDMGTGIRCLLAEDPVHAQNLASQLDELNKQRRGLQDQMQQEAMGQVTGLLESLGKQETPPAICLFDESWHQGIVGLVASRVKDVVHKPVVAFAPESAGSELLKGSARSVKGLHIRDVLVLVDTRYPGMILAFGGHAMAAGLTLHRESFKEFSGRLSQAVIDVLDGAELDSQLRTDGKLTAGQLGLDLATQVEAQGPWGQRFPEPLFDGRFKVIDARVVGGTHLKMIVESADGSEPIDAIAFNRLPENLPSSDTVRLLYRLGINRWRGNESCQLMVEEIVSQ